MTSNQCPSCQRLLYDRSLTHCGYCGARIPESLRFTKEQIAAIDRDMAELEEQRHQRLVAAAKKLEDFQDAMAAGCYVPFSDMPTSGLPFMGNGLE